MTNTKTLQQMSMAELKQELKNHYGSNAGEMMFGLIEMGLSQTAIKKVLIKELERKQK
jgi:hypothetical protein